MFGLLPANDVIAAFGQALLHKLAVQTAAAYRLSSRCSRCTACANGGGTCGNIFQTGFAAIQH
jgi:hypothetical protein